MITQKTSHLVYLFNSFFVSFWFFSQYILISPFSVGMALVIPIGILCIYESQKVVVDTLMAIFVSWILFQTLLLSLLHPSYLDTTILYKRIFFILIYFFIYVLFTSLLKENTVLFAYTVFSGIASVVLLHQLVTYYILGSVPWNGQLGFLTPISSWNQVNWRFNSLFSEPAAYAHYLSLLIYILLKKYKLVAASFFSVTIFISTSTSGIMLVFVIWVAFLLERLTSRNSGANTKIAVVALVLLFLLFLLVFLGTSPLERARQKLLTEDAISNERLLKGFALYAMYPPLYKLVGAGIGNVQVFSNTTNLYFPYRVMGDYQVNSEFASSISYAFLSLGIVGGVMYLYMLIYYFLHMQMEYRFLAILAIIIFLTSQPFFNAEFIMVFAIMYVYSDKKGSLTIRL